MTKRIEELSKLIPGIKYRPKDIILLDRLLEDELYQQMEAQFDNIQMGFKQFKFNYRRIRAFLRQDVLFKGWKSNKECLGIPVFLMKLLQKYPRVFLALTMPLENVPLYINRDYLAVFMRWRLLISK
jgi:hypothetical protein